MNVAEWTWSLVAASCVFVGSAPALIGTITTVAGTGAPGLAGEGGPAVAAELNHPRQLALDAAGNLFVAEVDNHRVRRIDVAGIITTIAGTTAGFSGDGGLASAAQLRRPVDVALDAGGDLFVADLDNHRIRRVDASTGFIETVAGSTPGFSGDGGQATAAELFAPYGVGVDALGNLFIADLGNQRVRRVDAASGVITTVAGTGTPGFSGDGGPASSAELYQPIDLAIDPAGHVFIADFENARIRRVDAGTGVITTVAGSGTHGFAGDGGPATAAQLDGPVGLALDPGGNLFIAELNNRRVRRVDAATGIVSTVAGTGDPGASGDAGLAVNATMEGPFGVVVEGGGALLVADRLAHQIRRAAAAPNPCAGGGVAGKHRLVARHLDTPPGDDRLSVVATATLPVVPPLDPVAQGARLVVTDAVQGAVLLDAEIPGGAYDAGMHTGWRANRAATAWTFVGDGGAGGVAVARVRTYAEHPGVVRVKVRGRDGHHGAMTVPVAAFLLLDPSTPASPQCIEATWPGVPPSSPACRLSPAGRELRCF